METVPLYFDADAYARPNSCLLANGTDARITTGFAFSAGDQFDLALYPRTKASPGDSTTITKRFTPGATILVTGKLTTALGAASLLFKAPATGQVFTEANTADDDSGDWFYTGYLNLLTNELLAAFGANGNLPYIQVMLMIVVTDPDTTTKRWIANIAVYNPGYTGTEGGPTDATAGNYLTAAQVAAGFIPQVPAQGNFRMKTETDGTQNMQFFCAADGLWHTWFPTLVNGVLTGQWSVGEA
jgi:hypothetical protein